MRAASTPPVRAVAAAPGIMFAAGCLTMMLLSLVTRPPEPDQVREHVWTVRLWHEDSERLAQKPWYFNYRYLSIGLVVLAAVIVVWWW